MQKQISSVRAVDRNARVFVPGLCKMHAPRQMRLFSPTAAGRKTALPSKGLAESNAGCERVNRDVANNASSIPTAKKMP